MIAVAKQIANGNANLQQRLPTYASDCIRPGLQYFETKLGSDLSPPVSAFNLIKTAPLFSPINCLLPLMWIFSQHSHFSVTRLPSTTSRLSCRPTLLRPWTRSQSLMFWSATVIPYPTGHQGRYWSCSLPQLQPSECSPIHLMVNRRSLRGSFNTINAS